MLETKELRYVITTENGKMIAGYNDLKDAEVDAEDICKSNKNKKFHIYVLNNSLNVTDTVLQKTFQLKTTYPLPEPEPESEEGKEEKEGEETKSESESESKDEEKKD
ncbi:MAG: hypothetical protein KAJ51_07525 [Thermoplasmata archaeon]|nr:hypothetical protein [Thermoplasmata archaeon]